MTALKHEVIQLVEQMPEEQMPYIIRYIRTLKDRSLHLEQALKKEEAITPKMKAFLELESMLVPLPYDLDYDKELAEARNERYDYIVTRNIEDFQHSSVKAITAREILEIISSCIL